MNQKKLLILCLFIPLVALAYISYKYVETKICENIETGYEIVDTGVYFKGRINNDKQCSVVKIELKEADPDTFIDLGFKIAKDKNNVYDASFKGYSVIRGVDVNSYFVFDRSYRKDVNNVYWYEEVIPNADPDSFEIIGEYSLAKDKNSFYQFGHAIEGVDETSFKVLNHYYAVASGNLYFTGKLLTSFTDESYELLGENYIRVGDFIWYNDKKINEADVESFIVISEEYSKDKNYVYYFGEVIKGEDPFDFEVP